MSTSTSQVWADALSSLEVDTRVKEWLDLAVESLLCSESPDLEQLGITLRQTLDVAGFPVWRAVVDDALGPQDLGGLLRDWRRFEHEEQKPFFLKQWLVRQNPVVDVKNIADPKLYFVWSRLSTPMSIEKLCAVTGLGTEPTRAYVERLFLDEMVEIESSESSA